MNILSTFRVAISVSGYGKVGQSSAKKCSQTRIDYKKTYDMVLQFWMVEYLKMFEIYVKIIKFITAALKNGKGKLTARGRTFAEVEILRGIFQLMVLYHFYL